MRTLAQRTQESTQEIHDLIERLQTEAKKSVTAMQEGQENADQTVAKAQEADTSLEAIAKAVGTITDMNNQIASAAEQQNAVAEDINRTVSTINQNAEETSSGAQQTAAASEELSALAQQLQELVQRFKVA